MSVIFQGEIEIREVSTGPYSNNSYIVVCPETRESMMIDTPAEPERILAEAKGTVVKGILITHCHMDHIVGHRKIKKATGAPVWVHESEAGLLPDPPEHLFGDGEGKVAFGTVVLRTIHVPGHTPGGTAFIWNNHLFSGDTLFPNGPGKTWSPQNFRQLVSSLEERIFWLPDDMIVHPGHGADTLLGREKALYRVFKERPHPPDLCGDVLWLSS